MDQNEIKLYDTMISLKYMFYTPSIPKKLNNLTDTTALCIKIDEMVLVMDGQSSSFFYPDLSKGCHQYYYHKKCTCGKKNLTVLLFEL